MSVRGNTRVTSENPEETYDVLTKYGQELVGLAKRNKLDPVIGRDSEIRNIIRILSRKTKNNPVLIGDPLIAAGDHVRSDVHRRQRIALIVIAEVGGL